MADVFALPAVPDGSAAHDPAGVDASNTASNTAVGAARKLSEGEYTSAATVAALVAVLALLGFVNSFTAVMRAAAESFGRLAFTVPLGIDLGIAIFAALDIVLARLDMRVRWLRLIPWSLTAATVYLNVASEHTMFGRIAHAVLPGLWVIAVEVAAHVVRVRAGIEAGTRMESIRASRWVLAPWPTLKLWRRMVLWEIRSYPAALRRERDRLLSLTDLQDTYGRIGWRWKAPRRTRALYRLGELTPAPAAPASVSPDRPAGQPAGQKTARKTAPGRSSAAPRGRSRTGNGKPKRTVPDVEDLMPLGRRIAADLDRHGQILKRDTLAARLRGAGQPVGSERVGALLARLKTDPPSARDAVEGDDTR
jgi:hypothetical protein